ncbi:MAG: hypothetical protein LBR53_02580 [Deltaproteobacteria bacterium]|nr:hypothetical protein [Deltaproteobacteria bacterium]
MKSQISLAREAVSKMNMAMERAGTVRMPQTDEIELKVSTLSLIEAALNLDETDVEESLSFVAARVHPDRLDEFFTDFQGVLVYGAVARRDLSSSRKYYQDLPSLRPDDEDGFTERAMVRAISSSNMVFLQNALNEPKYARPFLEDLSEAVRAFQNHLRRRGLSHSVQTFRLGLAWRPDGKLLPLYPPDPYHHATVDPPKNLTARKEPEAPKSSSLAALMRRAVGLKEPPGKNAPPAEAAPLPKSEELFSDAREKERLLIESDATAMRLFFEGLETTMENLLSQGLPDEAWELFGLAAKLMDPLDNQDTIRLAGFVHSFLSRAPLGEALDALSPRILNAALDRGKKNQPAAVGLLDFACVSYFERFDETPGNPETILRLTDKILSAPRFLELEAALPELVGRAFQAIGGGRGNTVQTFPGPLLTEERLLALSSLRAKVRKFKDGETALVTRQAMGIGILHAALAAEREDMVGKILKDLKSDPGFRDEANPMALLVRTLLCLHRVRQGRLREAEEHFARLEKASPLPRNLLSVWTFAATRLALTLAREGRGKEAEELARKVQKSLKDKPLKMIAHPLREILGPLPEEVPPEGDLELFQLFVFS